MTRPGTAHIAIVLAAAASVASCQAKKGGSCRLDTDCGEPLFCWLYTNTCESRCIQTSDCDEGWLCMCEPDRECPEVDDDTPLDDVQGGACVLPVSGDADTDDGPADPSPDPDATVDPDATDTAGDDPGLDPADTVDPDCGWDGTPDALPDGGCEPPSSFTEPVLLKTVFAIGVDGNPGSGLDLDGNPATCSPQPDVLVPDAQCSGGIENAMWGLGLLANEYISTDLASGSLNLLIELPGYGTDGCTFTMNVFRGDRVPADPAYCPDGSEPCDYEIVADSFDDQCLALATIPGARVSGTHLSAGPSVQPYLFTLVVVGLNLIIPLREARFEGEVVPGTSGPDGLSGILGGYIVETELFDVFEAIPPEDYPMPGKDEVIALIHQLYTNNIIVNDRDMNGDTVMDAASLGVIIEAVPAHITGVGG